MKKITLKAARVNCGLSQKEAAKKLGIAESTLYKWESGKNKPNTLKHQLNILFFSRLTRLNRIGGKNEIIKRRKI